MYPGTLTWLVGVHDEPGGTRLGMAGWVIRVGNTGEYLPSHTARGEVDPPAKRAPEAPQGLEWVGGASSGVRGLFQVPPLRGPVGLQPPCTWARSS